ncbi:hypothetical protein ILUMI_09187 [Ignelater luminosus]|uniref:Uncharacterized protein n=1 Tax=Ignelater luminosus TaxID=2038154 RepID=A0A8K0D2X2_IGNLU|nr:hypothetical protein ILUMI_09187 [Ignelater luminosus]
MPTRFRATAPPVKVTIVTPEPEPEANPKSGSATNLLVIVGCLFLLINIFVFVGLYYKCVRLRNKEKKRREEYEAAAMEHIDQKLPDSSSVLDGCNLMRMISKSSKSEDIYEAVKVSGEEGSNNRFKLMRQMSSSTIDPHTKVRDWIAQEIVQRCSPRFLRRTKQQLAEEHKAAQQKQQENAKPENNVVEVATIGSNSTLGQSPTRPVSPEDKITIGELKPVVKSDTSKPSGIPLPKPALPKKPEKVSVAVDATPAGRGSSVMRQQPIEFAKSLDYEHLEPEHEVPLRRSFTMDDVVNLPSESDNLRRSSTSINLKFPPNGLRIQHSQSKSDPVQDFNIFIPGSNSLPRKLQTFEPQNDVNVTSKDEFEDKIQPLTPEQQLQTIKRRNFPKVLPDLPQSAKEALVNKRRSMPASGYLNLPIPEISSFSQPTSPTGKPVTRLPPAPPPRTTSTLNRKPNTSRVCQTPAALAEEPPLPAEPELTYNNLYIGPLVPANIHKKSESATDLYKQNIQLIYEHLRPAKSQEQALEKREPKTIITADLEHPVKRVEPKVVIKPTITKKTGEPSAVKPGARVIARNSSDEKFDIGKISEGFPKGVKTEEGSREEPSDGANKDVKIIGSKVKLQKASQIPTLAKTTNISPPKKESSSSESTPSEESDTGTVVKRV